MVDEENSRFDVAIVGGGVSGLYAAWRLYKSSSQKKRPKIAILEKSNRLGGRLKTSQVKLGSKPILVEDGGMRFLETHERLMHLLDELNLMQQKRKFGMGDVNNAYFIRGQRFTRKKASSDQNAWWQNIYNLAPHERNKSPHQIVQEVLRRVVNEMNAQKWIPSDPFSWNLFRQTEYPAGSGLKIYEWGFRALLEDLGLSNECVQMLIDTGGFSIPYDDMVGAGSGLQLIASFPEKPDFYTLENGYEELPRALQREILQHVTIKRENEIRRIVRSKNSYELETTDNTRHNVLADKVIIALPVMPMKKLLAKSSGMSDFGTVISNLDKVVHMPLTKINLYFQSRWWKTKEITHGGCFTDIQLAQVYFFDIDTDDPEREFTGITIYSDGYRSNYWRQLQSLGKEFRRKPPIDSVETADDIVHCTEAVVKHALAQLRQMFSMPDIPEPFLATMNMWGGTALGEGDHQWAVGADDQAIRADLVEIDKGIFLCGEAISDYQDWVEGALRSVDFVLERGFKLKPPF